MERNIQPQAYARPVTPTTPTQAPSQYLRAAPLTLPHSAPAKSTGDYLRALRRRAWLALAVALAVAGPGAAWVAKRPAIYQATAQIQIDPPEFDPILPTLLPNGDVGRRDPSAIERYVPNHLNWLKGRRLAERVVSGPLFRREGAGGDPSQEVLANLTTRNLPQTSVFDVYLEGTDPARTAGLLNEMVRTFADDVNDESVAALEKSREYAKASLDKYDKELENVDKDIRDILQKSPLMVSYNGKSLLEARYGALMTMLMEKRIRHEDIKHQRAVADLYPVVKGQAAAPTPVQQRIAKLQEERAFWKARLAKVRSLLRDPGADLTGNYVAEQLRETEADLNAELAKVPRERPMPDRGAIALGQSREEIYKLEREVGGLLDELRRSMPTFQEYTALVKSREQKAESIAQMQRNLGKFQLLLETQNKPVKILLEATEPTAPIKPSRGLYMALIAVAGLALGAALVCLLEHLDHSVKVPEQLSAGLALPLFGVVPRMRRLAHWHRGGHLWTAAAPTSLEADAYRNIRASLLGLDGPDGDPPVTLLVTSAKAGEGKSTTALNLAATCARAGERTLLLDVDLRRPSLANVFDDDEADRPGLVDVLRGDLSWQRTVVRTDQPNLDFLPTGATEGVPIEVLGTLEMRQLLRAVAGHYDRVVLDGPAVLGLADCRMLGRMVDAALLVVRSGAHGLRPLQRARAMLEQSRVPLAGVIFNGLADDYQNWSSYGTPGYAAPTTKVGRPVSGMGTDDAGGPVAVAAAVALGA
ncbi:MAG TPA: polysaccharide biosynthesis tyrosine autokinase [Isosphaeraceae bacterium]|jgi:capsular exopolysaccharide synthesis family protein|nr:polysaccharide biosynthesis tyrosine autokinase [Isosphaeraceae bacterium]